MWLPLLSASCLSLWKGSPEIWNISSVVMFQLHAYVLTRMDRLLRINLEDVLELTFPCPQDTDQDDISANCIICYNYRLPHGTYVTYLYHCLMDYDSFWVEAIWKIICDCLIIQWLYFIYHLHYLPLRILAKCIEARSYCWAHPSWNWM